MVLLGLLCAWLACDSERDWQRAIQLTGGKPELAEAALGRYGCGSCHTIPGIGGANGRTGPPLSGMAVRLYIGGELPNTPENLIRWIQHPRQVEPRTAMPELNVSDEDANITAYLYTLK